MSLSEHLKNINAAADAFSVGKNVTETEKTELLAACDRLRGALETPLDLALRMTFSSHQTIAVRLGIDMKLFDIAAAAAGANVTIKQLASPTSADPLLVRRVVRMLAPIGLFNEVDVDTFTLDPSANIYLQGSPIAQAIIHGTAFLPAVANLPAYLSSTNYQNPNDAYDGPWQYGMSTPLHYFSWVATKPIYQAAFNATMAVVRRNRGPEWYKTYPVSTELSLPPSSPPNRVLLVDIGGGIGHELLALHATYPSLPGSLVLQDLPTVIDTISPPLPTGIQAMQHDFFAPQPIKGAKAYYMRAVLHDWPDKQALIILKHIRDAMAEDSVLLVNEAVIEEKGVGLFNAYMDLTMMVGFNAMERTRKQLEGLLEEAGLVLKKVWEPEEREEGGGTILEAVRRE